MHEIVVPSDWEAAAITPPNGVLLVVGGPSTGKSTFSRYLYERLADTGRSVALLDGDPGQTSLGPPSTMTVAAAAGFTRRWFAGSTSPRGHMLPVLIGAARLIEAARGAGAETIIYDTCGLIDPAQGGRTLKLAMIDLLGPAALFALQAESELEPLLRPLRASGRAPVVALRPSPVARSRSPAERQRHRSEQYARYFAHARPHVIDPAALPAFPARRYLAHRLVALEDSEGFVLGLAIVLEHEPDQNRLVLQASLPSLQQVRAIRMGDLLVDPASYRDQMIGLALR